MDDSEEGDGRRGRRAAGVGRPDGVAEAGRRMQATRRRPRGRDEGVALVRRRREEEGLGMKEAVRAVAADTGLNRNELYAAALKG